MAKTSLGTTVYGPDSSYVEGLSNIASMFDPKAQAAGALSQAHTDYYSHQAALADAQARLNAAKAASEEARHNANNIADLVANGMDPLAARLYVGSGDNSFSSIAKGNNTFTGGQNLINANGDVNKIQTGLALTGQGATAYGSNFAPNPDVATANKILVAQGTPRTVGEGQTAYVMKDGAAIPVISGMTKLSAGQTAYNNSGGVLTQSATSPVATGSAADPVKVAAGEQSLIDKMNNSIIAATSTVDSTGKAYTKTPPLEQVNSVSEYALKLLKSRQATSYADALNQSAIAHGIKLNQQALVAETAPGKFFGTNETGRHLLSGFHNPNGSVNTSQLNQPSESAPVIIPKTQADIDNAPVGAILVKPDGSRFIKSAPKPSGKPAQGSTVNVSNSPLAAQMPQAMPEASSPGIDYGKLQDLFNTVDPSKARGIVGIDHPFMSPAEAVTGINEVASRLGLTQPGKQLSEKEAFALKSKIAEIISPMAMQDPRIAQWAKGNFSGDVGLPDDAMKTAEALGINRQQYGIPEAGWAEKTPLGLGSIIAMKSYGELNKDMPIALQRFYSDLLNRNKVAQQ